MEIVTKVTQKQIKSSFSHNNTIDVEAGVFEVNCKGFVNHVLSSKAPDALAEIVNFMCSCDYELPLSIDGSPRSHHYVYFFKSLLDNQNSKSLNWQSVTSVNHLKRGDILAYTFSDLEKINERGMGQHVMIVAEPIEKNIAGEAEAIVSIFDSTKTPHGESDIRQNGKTGIGRGEICLKTDSNGCPIFIKWDQQKKKYQPKAIAIGRLKGSVKI